MNNKRFKTTAWGVDEPGQILNNLKYLEECLDIMMFILQ